MFCVLCSKFLSLLTWSNYTAHDKASCGNTSLFFQMSVRDFFQKNTRIPSEMLSAIHSKNQQFLQGFLSKIFQTFSEFFNVFSTETFERFPLKFFMRFLDKFIQGFLQFIIYGLLPKLLHVFLQKFFQEFGPKIAGRFYQKLLQWFFFSGILHGTFQETYTVIPSDVSWRISKAYFQVSF